jgi:DNA polymerase III delta prime subunit
LRLGDLLIRGKLVAVDDVSRALEHQAAHGGRLGESLVAIGALSQSALDTFLHRLPSEPADIGATGLDATELMGLLLKIIYVERLETVRQYASAIKLPYHIVLDLVRMAVDRKLLMTLGSRDTSSLADLAYMFSEEGRRWALDALGRVGYSGPAPVTIEEFTYQVNLQKLTNEVITFDRIRKATAELTFEDALIEQCGPALNSGRAMLLYGPPGNGKTSVAHCLANVFNDVIYVPYSISIEGQIIRVFDPSLHVPLDRAEVTEDDALSLVRREVFDARWVPCRRPFVIAGGELTLDMLDLRYDLLGHFYEAPLHLKALGGCFVIDDFGRQLVSPTNLLNRWIVPLENRHDYLKLHTGKSFSIPFEELIIFSTNLEPEDLMDPAFLRRLPYKIEVGPPSVDSYRQIFEIECAKYGFTISRDVFTDIVYKLTEEKGLELAAYQPRFIVDQVVASCRFMQMPPTFEPRFINNALNNLRVHRRNSVKNVTAAIV